MKDYILDNGIKLIYKESTSELSSIAISLDAGAGRDGDVLGVAHATEHMVYKGTKNMTEVEINEALSNIFGFQNAMTNYPYVVYYGTLLSEDLKAGIELFADILINPIFNKDGFEEELSVIKEELNEWDEELEQFCEDKLFLNCFENRRLKYPIIGTTKSLESIKLEDIKKFYNKCYFPGNISIAVTSSLGFEDVKVIVEDKFGTWNKSGHLANNQLVENPKEGIYTDRRLGLNASKVEIIFPIHQLNNLEIKALRIFNQYFGEGVNSVLFDTLRTKNGLVYDVLTKISNEQFIKLYKITFSTGNENVGKAIDLIQDTIKNISQHRNHINSIDLERLIKSFKLKRLFGEEQSVRLAMALATYNSMFGDCNLYLEETQGLDELTIDYIFDTAIKVLNNMSVEVITK